ncbi:MAG TPA: FtsQ-type POTRA domain-containing protein [Terriglobales bacterium]|nr:FtsQ-type POTRA domain-containing protein [Terriglobales bacterium]
MARNNGPLIPDEELTTRRGSPDSAPPDDSFDARFRDLETEDSAPFLRAQKRVPVRRGTLPKKTAGRIKVAAAILGAVVVVGAAANVVYGYGAHSWRFRIESGDDLEIAGTENVTRHQVMEVMGGDIGKNIFFVSLEDQKRKLEEIPWVESADVMRLMPNKLRVTIQERTPVAFVQVGPKIALIDAHGVVMDMPANGAKRYSFPVIVGMGESEPLSTRAPRMKTFMELTRDLDADGSHSSQDLSEVDLSDPDDVKITVADPQGELLVHLGSSNFADRFRIYKTHVQEWRQQFQHLDSVDLRYDRQVIVNPDAAKEDSAHPQSAPPKHPAAIKKR